MSVASRHPLYPTWWSMNRRCSEPTHWAYHRYGGRGIFVCQRWKSDFSAFVADMGPRPLGCTLNRINNDGNYEPGNCNWATYHEQANNRSPRRQISFGGVTLTVPQWARKSGLSEQAIRKRIRAGWSVQRILTEPLKTSSPELMRAAASRAGKAVAPEKRGFSRDRTAASRAGAMGGRAVPAEKRSFSFDRELASSAGQKGAKAHKTAAAGGRYV